MVRIPSCSKEGLKRGAWTAHEDKILTEYIAGHGEGRWRTLPKKAGLQRCGKSCRLRWLNYLRPDIKRGNISPDEEELIIRLHKLLGNRWSLIAGRLPGRTDNEIKNYWNTNLVKKVQENKAASSQSNEKTPDGSTDQFPLKSNPDHLSTPSNVHAVDEFNMMGEFSLDDILDSDFFHHGKDNTCNYPYHSVEHKPWVFWDDDDIVQECWTRSYNCFEQNESFSSVVWDQWPDDHGV